MEPDELSDAESVLRGQLGDKVHLRLQDRDIRTPMNLVLDRAEKELGLRFSLYWVTNGPPELFCLNGFSEPVVAFSTRYLELWADLRRAMVSPAESSLRQNIIEHLSLRIIAELSLTRDNPEFAGCCILQAAMDPEGIFLIPNDLASLEYEPIGVPYMACWFYGLTHEMGHFTHTLLRKDSSGAFPEQFVKTARDEALSRLTLPPEIEQEVVNLMKSRTGDFILSSDILQTEMTADVFGTSALLASTIEITQIVAKQAGQEIEWTDLFSSFISEMMMSLVIIGILDRCRRAAIFASTAEPQRKFAIESILHPAAIETRIKAVLSYLTIASESFLFDGPTTPEHDKLISDLIASCLDSLRPSIEDANRGLSNAMSLCLDRQRRPSLFSMASDWRTALTNGNYRARVTDVQDFLKRAQQRGKWSPFFDTLAKIAEDPSIPLEVNLSGEDYVLFCAWIKGPDGFNRPFGLETRHGYLIFLFSDKSKLFDDYVAASTGWLEEGFSLITTSLIVRSPRDAHDAIALRLPVGAPFRVVIEGTEDFRDYMEQLIKGTIWPDS